VGSVNRWNGARQPARSFKIIGFQPAAGLSADGTNDEVEQAEHLQHASGLPLATFRQRAGNESAFVVGRRKRFGAPRSTKRPVPNSRTPASGRLAAAFMPSILFYVKNTKLSEIARLVLGIPPHSFVSTCVTPNAAKFKTNKFQYSAV
jgi:hypothetical protein